MPTGLECPPDKMCAAGSQHNFQLQIESKGKSPTRIRHGIWAVYSHPPEQPSIGFQGLEKTPQGRWTWIPWPSPLGEGPPSPPLDLRPPRPSNLRPRDAQDMAQSWREKRPEPCAGRCEEECSGAPAHKKRRAGWTVSASHLCGLGAMCGLGREGCAPGSDPANHPHLGTIGSLCFEIPM